MKLQMDFTTDPGKNFGVILPLTDRVLALPNPVDVWLPQPTAQNMVIEGGRVSSWIGRRNGRSLAHAVAARRPRPENGLLRFSSDALGNEAQLDLAGAAIGQQSAFTIAVHGRIHPEQLAFDNQYFLGSSVSGAMARIAYRFTNGTRYIRYQTNDNSLTLDAPLPPDWNGIVGVVAVIDGLNIRLDLTTGGTNSRLLTVPFNLQSFMVGAAATLGSTGSLRGYIGNLGLWTRAVTTTEREMLSRWVQ